MILLENELFARFILLSGLKNILLLAKIYFSDKVLLWVTHQLVTLHLLQTIHLSHLFGVNCCIFYTFGRVEDSKEATGARSVSLARSAYPLSHLSVLVLVLVAGLAGRARTPQYK